MVALKRTLKSAKADFFCSELVGSSVVGFAWFFAESMPAAVVPWQLQLITKG